MYLVLFLPTLIAQQYWSDHFTSQKSCKTAYRDGYQ